MNFVITLIFCILLYSSDASSGAWLQEYKKIQAIYTQNFTLDNKFSDGYHDFYFEYGLKDKTIGANFYIKNTDKNFRENYYKDDRILNFFIRKKWFENDQYLISSEKVFYLKPAGYKHKLLIGRGFNNNLKPFVNVEFSLHKNYIDPVNLKTILTTGFHISEKLMFIAESINCYRHYKLRLYNIEDESNKKIIFYKGSTSKLAFSMIYKLDNRYNLQIGYSDRIHKKYRDKNFFTAVWLSI